MTTVLAVDDSATMRRCLEITFAGTDLNAITCDGPSAALEKIKTLHPGLVIVDASLSAGAGDGYDLCATIKLTAPKVPLLLLTSKQAPFDSARGAKVDDHIDKPFDTQALYDKAKSLLHARSGSTEVPKPIAHAPAAAAAPVAAAARVPAARQEQQPARNQTPLNLAPAAMPVPAEDKTLPSSQARPVPSPPTGKHPSNAPPRKQPAPAALAPREALAQKPMPDLARKTIGFVPGAAQKDVTKTAPDLARPDLGKTTPGFSPDPEPAPRPPAFGPDVEPVARRSPALGRTMAFETLDLSAKKPQPAAAESPASERARLKETFPGLQPAESHDEPLAPPPAPDASEAPAPSRARRQTLSGVPAHDGNGSLPARLAALGLNAQQIDGVLALSREVLEQVVWEVVPQLAETLIKEEIKRLTDD